MFYYCAYAVLLEILAGSLPKKHVIVGRDSADYTDKYFKKAYETWVVWKKIGFKAVFVMNTESVLWSYLI